MIYRHVNYTNRAKCIKTLHHSLRIKTTNFKKNEWSDDLEKYNYIFTPGATETRLEKWTLETKNQFMQFILKNTFGEKSSESDRKNFKRYEYKLLKKIDSAEKNGEVLLAKTLRHIAEKKPENYRELIEKIDDVKRRKQLISMLDKYVLLAKKTHGSTDQRHAKIHEAFFKFPHKNGIKTDAEAMARCIRTFYQEHAADYKIIFIAVHDDERTSEMETGIHPHIFISTQNKKTGRRDLAKTLRNAANKYLVNYPFEIKLWNQETKKHESKIVKNIDETVGSYAASKLQGIIIQDMFMFHVRKNFPALDVIWSENRERRIKAFHTQYEDAKLAKADREYNFNNFLCKKNQLMIKEIRDLNDSLKNNELTNEQLKRSITTKEQQIENLSAKYDSIVSSITNQIQRFVEHYKQLLSSVITENSNALIHALNANAAFDEAAPHAQKTIMDIVNEEQNNFEIHGINNDSVIIHNDLCRKMQTKMKI